MRAGAASLSIKVWVAVSMSRAATGHPAKDHAGLSTPRQLGELVHRADDHRGREPVDFLIDRKNRQPLHWGLPPRKGTTSVRIRTVEKQPPFLIPRIQVTGFVQWCRAPRAR